MIRYILIFLIVFLSRAASVCAQEGQLITGTVTDSETGAVIEGANIIVSGSVPPNGATSDAEGGFRIFVSYGRVTLKVSFLGYDDLLISNILVSSGKQVRIEAKLREKAVMTGEVVVNGSKSASRYVNPMATISAHTLRASDAIRYAGGFYDASRMVSSFAGVAGSNSDHSNELIIRGNSPRGLLWRLEGIEIPNPNHFSDGKGGSGGAFAAITSNVIDNFDFLTGAFPAEYGNAFSGVMDLNLRKGNPEKHEFAFQTGMIGAELSSEGPIAGKSSYLVNARYTNFSILSNLNLIDLGENNHAPRTRDAVFNINVPVKKSGYFNLFGFYGSSETGKIAEDPATWTKESDRWEEMEQQSSGVIGLKNVYILPGSGSFIRTVISYSGFTNRYNEGYADSSLVRNDTYLYNYSYPALRLSTVINKRINARNYLRTGFYFNHLEAEMLNLRMTGTGIYDTLVAPSGNGNLMQSFVQWKLRISGNLELNTGMHYSRFTVNRKDAFEPRMGLRWEFSPGNALSAGAGFHSRTEALSVYYAAIKTAGEQNRSILNKNIGFSKAFHLVGGLEITLTESMILRSEAYLQRLYNIPVELSSGSKYSTLNSSEGLPDARLVNEGLGFNRGVELTIEKDFTGNYFLLASGSIFTSRYRAGDWQWYNTYYNTGYAANLLSGLEIPFGPGKRNVVGLTSRLMVRGGYRYTPVDQARTMKSKRIVYDRNKTYSSSLPDFVRIDGGISYRRNQPGYSWLIMVDIQNVLNRRNVFRKRFSYSNGEIISSNVFSLGMVPVLNFRVEF